MENITTDAKNCQNIVGENMINTLPDDLLVKILLLVPTKDAVATMILSKRWLSIWTMLPELDYKETNDVIDGEQKSVWQFLDKSLKVHKAPLLQSISVELGPRCPVDEDVGDWISNAIDPKVRMLFFELNWSANPIKLPRSLYTCDTLVNLSLSDKILVDIISPACLPSLTWLVLQSVVFKDEDCLVRLLSSCPILKCLHVVRNSEDNVTNFKLKVSSLEILVYQYEKKEDRGDISGSLTIDSPALKTFVIWDFSGDSCSIEKTPRLARASLVVSCYPGDKFMRYLPSLTLFDIHLNIETVKCCTTINFSQLVECRIQPIGFDWLEPLMVLVQNSPKLKLLFIDQSIGLIKDSPLSWNRPCSVPKCMETHLEIFEWNECGGRCEEKELVRYILANSRCLKRVAISIISTCDLEDKKNMMNELESMSRISQSSQLMYTPTILNDKYIERAGLNVRVA